MVGIAGVGMEGLARILAARGCSVTGTDSTQSPRTDALKRDGFDVRIGHRAERILDADLVVYSAAVPSSNEELRAARKSGIDIVGRAELLGEISRTSFTIAVAGTHGKTTTAAMLANILDAAGLDPSIAIGGYAGGEIQGRSSVGGYFVVEADEFDRSFLKIYPSAVVVTSIDAEHLDCYENEAGIREAFVDFLGRLPFYGQAVLAGENVGVREVVSRLAVPFPLYGLNSESRFHPRNIEQRTWGTDFDLFDARAKVLGIQLNVPGQHNLLNAVGAAAMAVLLGIEAQYVSTGLRRFSGLDRRFERKGEKRNVLVVDDYAHHPAEVGAALATARSLGRPRVTAVFQPHLYSRTRDFFREFGSVLALADLEFITDVYPAREAPIPGITGALIADDMRDNGFRAVQYESDADCLAARIAENCRENDLILTMGAGDIGDVANSILAAIDKGASGVEGEEN